MITEYTRHPASAAWGDMAADEYAALVESMKTHGYEGGPVVAIEQKIVDGWHRYNAAKKAGCDDLIPIQFLKPATSGEDIARYVNARHCARRNLTATERAERVVATKRACGVEFAEPGRPKTGQGDLISVNGVAEDAGVSVSTAKRAVTKAKETEADKVIKRAKKSGAQARERKRDSMRDELDLQRTFTEVAQNEAEDARAAVVELKARTGEDGVDVADAVAEWKNLAEERHETIKTLRGALLKATEKQREAEAAVAEWKTRYMKIEERLHEANL